MFLFALFTSTLACLFIAVPSLIIFSFLGSGGELKISTLLLLSVIGVFLLWLSSTLFLVLALLVFGRGGGAKRRWLLGGLGVGVGYLAIILWGGISPVMAIYLLAGFGAGYLAAFIVDKTSPNLTDSF